MNNHLTPDKQATFHNTVDYLSKSIPPWRCAQYLNGSGIWVSKDLVLERYKIIDRYDSWINMDHENIIFSCLFPDLHCHSIDYADLKSYNDTNHLYNLNQLNCMHPFLLGDKLRDVRGTYTGEIRIHSLICHI